jgi:hypothetical protein
MLAGGHHAGLASFLANTIPVEVAIKLSYVSHKDIDTSIASDLQQAGFQVCNDFTVNFYEYFEKNKRISDMQVFINLLTSEYIKAISKNSVVEATNLDCPQLFFYPCLSWEHAYCLALAIKFVAKNDNIKHIACAMFSPGIDQEGCALDVSTAMNACLSFNFLQQCDNVTIYASDKELVESFDRILRKQSIELHPCYLADWENLALDRDVSDFSPMKRYVLYMGDAKINKGFCDLPEIIDNLLSQIDDNSELYVQYTYLWEDDRISAAQGKLRQLAASDKRLAIHDQYLSHQAMQQVLQRADSFVFTYHANAYQNKSSGLLWLIAWYQLDIVIPQASWLNRELENLAYPNNKIYNSVSELLSLTMPRDNEALKLNSYGKLLYKPFWKWLLTTENKEVVKC